MSNMFTLPKHGLLAITMLVETVIILHASVTLHTCTSFNTNIYVKGKNTSNKIKKYHTDRTTPKSNRQNRRKSQNRHPLHTYT